MGDRRAMLEGDGARSAWALRSRLAWCGVVLLLAAPRLPAQAAPTDEGGAEPPGAYAVSFRIITAEAAEVYQQGLLADLHTATFCFAPADSDGFYDQVALRHDYGPAISPMLVATVGQVYTMCIRPGGPPVEVRGVTGDGKREWSVVCFGVEPSAEDASQVTLVSAWHFEHLLSFDVPDPGGTSTHTIGVPLNLHGGMSKWHNKDAEHVGTGLGLGYVVLVLIEPARP